MLSFLTTGFIDDWTMVMPGKQPFASNFARAGQETLVWLTSCLKSCQVLRALADEVGHTLRNHNGRGVGIGPNHIGHH